MIGIAIVNYKTWETTLRCVASIERVCTRPFHIYLVDNHSPNDALRALREAYRDDGNVTVLDAGKNGGYGFGLNCGIRAAIADGCDAIIASNNDIIYLEGAIETMYDCLTSSPQIGCAGAAQRTESGGEMYSAQFAPDTALSMALRYIPLRGKLELRRYARRVRGGGNLPVFCPMGGCYMLRAEAIQAAGFFDESVFMYCEENILGFRLRKAGYTARLCTEARVIHEKGKTTGNSKTRQKIKSVESILRYGKQYLGWRGIHRTVFANLLRLNLFLSGKYDEEAKRELNAALEAGKRQGGEDKCAC